jgi:hypothetical protein
MSAPEVFVGIDVAKAHRDIALCPTGERWVVTHHAIGLADSLARCQAAQPTLTVLAATGGYHRAVVAALAAAAWPFVVIHPRQEWDVAQATGPWPTLPRRCDCAGPRPDAQTEEDYEERYRACPTDLDE